MVPEIAYAVFFGGLALLAQYLPSRLGIPLGLLAIALSVWQLGWGGWQLGLAIGLTALVLWRILIHRGLFEKDKGKEARKIAKTEQAQKLQNEIVDLLSALNNEESKLSETDNWKSAPVIKNILSNLQSKLNTLGYLINNSQFDRWAEQMVHMYSHMMTFHIKDSDSFYDEWGRARINAKFRYYISKIKG